MQQISRHTALPAPPPLTAMPRLLFMPAVAALFIGFLLAEYGWQKAALALTAMVVGAVFFRYQFGFSYTWRVLLTRGDGRGLRAQMLWIGLAALPFALLGGGGDILPAQAAMNIRPLTVAVAFGAFMFGIGMQMGGACTSGALVGAGGGGGMAAVSLIFLVGGALHGASHMDFWTTLPAAAPVSLYDMWGLFGACCVILPVLFIACVTLLLPRRGAPAAAAPAQNARPPLWRGAIILAALSVALLFFGGQPWGLIYGFAIAGGKIAIAAGFEDVQFWDFWATLPGGEEQLYGGWFSGVQLPTIAAMLIGVALAAVAAGGFRVRRRLPPARRVIAAAAGGWLMGYGALISYGCNIGSYVSALSSGSLHGLLWFVFALLGTAAGIPLRRLAGLEK